jgi:hypothetical protein
MYIWQIKAVLTIKQRNINLKIRNKLTPNTDGSIFFYRKKVKLKIIIKIFFKQ